MTINKSLITGSTTMLILKLLEDKDMYGYLMIEELKKKSYEESADSKRIRKYYSITKKGKQMLLEKQSEWNTYTSAINQVLQGGASFAI